ncbi:MAG TPA: DUF72 domain-containing protein [Blastocatellia bacterium]|nr:DUF72 domain-containing protein [Blastocatellia bacterium]
MGKKPVRIGCCGFRSSRESYYGSLPAVEVQHTFYQPPQPATLRRWRDEAPKGFEFTMKAWQLITHESRSPTYKRLKRELSSTEKEEAGSFRPTAIVKEAWDVTCTCAKALGARVVLFQCPASFRPTSDNVENMLRFFSEADRRGLTFVWEPRGDWPGELIKDLCKDLDLWHVVDPFSGRTLTPRRCYFRLHGRGGWKYSYEDGELEELYSMLPRGARSYVFFNNVEMRRDALRFKEIAETAD